MHQLQGPQVAPEPAHQGTSTSTQPGASLLLLLVVVVLVVVAVPLYLPLLQLMKLACQLRLIACCSLLVDQLNPPGLLVLMPGQAASPADLQLARLRGQLRLLRPESCPL